MIKIPEKIILSKYIIIEDSLFEDFPFSSEKGGAIFSSAVDCILKTCIFNLCSAAHGGAVAIENSEIFLIPLAFQTAEPLRKMKMEETPSLPQNAQLWLICLRLSNALLITVFVAMLFSRYSTQRSTQLT